MAAQSIVTNRRQWLMAMTAALGAHHVVKAEPAGQPALKVVASFSILADMVRIVAGPLAQVESLVKADTDAHVYEPSPRDAKTLRQANLVFINGLHFEGWIERLVNSSGYSGPLITVSDGLPSRLVGGHIDPHAWQDLQQAAGYVDHIEAALIAQLPQHRQTIQAQAKTYKNQILSLHESTLRAFAALPAMHKRVLTSHDAFAYFGAAYGVQFIAPQGWTTDTEPSAAKVAALVREVKAKQVRAIFVENMTDQRLVRLIAQATGTRIGGTLYADALSKPTGPAATYLALMQHNIQSLLEALR